MFEAKVNVDCNNLEKGINEIPGEKSFGFKDLFLGLFGDLKQLSEDINNEIEGLEKEGLL